MLGPSFWLSGNVFWRFQSESVQTLPPGVATSTGSFLLDRDGPGLADFDFDTPEGGVVTG